MTQEARIETVIPPETVVVLIAGLLAVAHTIGHTFYEDDGIAKQAWDIYDAVFVEADERYKETGDGEATSGGEEDPGFGSRR